MKKYLLSIILIFTLITTTSYAIIPDNESFRYEHRQFYGTVRKEICLNLMYHSISVAEKPNDFIITPEQFESDIKYLASQGYKFLTGSEVHKAKNASYSEKTVVITFDDGYASDYIYALPILKKYNAKATFFVVGSLINTPAYMTSEQLILMSQSGHAEIGNHSYQNHILSYEELMEKYNSNPLDAIKDFEKNADFIRSITGKRPTSISYPYGLYTPTLDHYFNSRGYTRFCSTEAFYQDIRLPYIRFNRSNARSPEELRNILVGHIG